MSEDRLNITHVYGGNPLDRGDVERRDDDWLKDRAKDPTSRFLPMWELNVPITRGNPQGLHWLDVDDLRRLKVDEEPVFLGLLGGKAHFAVDITKTEPAVAGLQGSRAMTFEDARTATEYLSGPESGIVAQARSQINWHNRHGFCAACGHETAMGRGGQVRRCPNCDTEHYPRTDPVVIVVVSDGDRCLLGQSRGRLAAQRRYSALAGFMDHGESIEEAVAREVMEEAGIKVGRVRYHSSQPWPFPSSLMIGCHADAETTEIAMDEVEMSDVRWFGREEVLLALQGKSDQLALPGSIAIAYHLITAWANGDMR